MKYLKRFESNENISIYDYVDDFKDIVQDISDNTNYEISTNYECKYYDYHNNSSVHNAISILINHGNDYFIDISKLLDYIMRMKKISSTINCDIHIDPDNRSMEFLSVEDFISEYEYEEIVEMDIIIFDRKNLNFR
jgi:hypothetical protein